MDAPRSADLTRDQLDALGEQIAEHATHIDAAIHRLLVDIRAFEAAGGWFKQGARSMAEWLSWRIGWDGNTARDHVRVATALAKLPKIDETLRRGELSYSKVRAMARVATPENEETLIEDAKHCTAMQLEILVRKYAAVKRGLAPTPEQDAERRRITKRDLEDGMVCINATLHREEAELVWEALTRIAKERDAKTFSRVDALVEMAEQVMRGTSPERSPVDIVVTVPIESLTTTTDDPIAATTKDGVCLSAETVRRLACDAGLITMVEDGAGNTVSVGRKTRTISSALWRAVIKRDQHCRFPGCCNKVYLDGHHAKHWANGGETSLENVLALCKYHHRFVHEYGYRVEMDERQQPTFCDARGRAVVEVVQRPPRRELGHSVIARANAPLAITASTAQPRWDGSKVDYEWIVDGLCTVDGLKDVSAETVAGDRLFSRRERDR